MKNFIVCCLALLILSACGFTPMYGDLSGSGDDTVQAKLNDINIANIPDRQGQMLRNNLIDRFYRHGRPSDAAYTLTFANITETKTDLDLTKNADATRSQLSEATNMTLTDSRTGKILLERSLFAAASYDILDSRFTTRVSEADAQNNAIEDLARQAEQQIVLYFRR